ncbi:putative poly-beta-1,6-N-acetyl-D-glucosamine export protein [Pelotomaculum sp. FP]|uniref:acyltransferase n=1 Tax=Pelotomaculum sp. FP TaxID=261474 RepID=UPI001102B6AA|nr:acyltransferase [Pelotomaculum sp. FP]TEB14380.1 putative poly-beta-1,6-N-acetyl-D-glucosamine export protein [Pelotomaculum sp. FP]
MTRLKEFDYIRAISIIAVIMIHIGTSGLIIRYGNEITLKHPMSTYYIYHQVTAFAVSAFVCISGLVLCLKYKDKSFNYFKFIGTRIWYIIIPFAIWTLVYLKLNNLITVEGSGKINLPFDQLGIALLSGGAYYHMYYIPLLFSLYLLFPLFRLIAKKFKSPWWLVLLLLFQHYAQIRFNTALTPEALKLFQFRYFIFLFAVGCYIGEHYDEVKTFINKHINAIVGLLGVVLLYKIVFFYYSVYHLKTSFKDVPQTITFDNRIYTLLIIALIIYITPQVKNRVVDLILDRLGKNSFGIYLIHPLILRGIDDIVKQNKWFNLSSEAVLVVLVITVVISYAISELVNLIPYGYLFVGKNDRAIGVLKVPKLSDIVTIEVIKK